MSHIDESFNLIMSTTIPIFTAQMSSIITFVNINTRVSIYTLHESRIASAWKRALIRVPQTEWSSHQSGSSNPDLRIKTGTTQPASWSTTDWRLCTFINICKGFDKSATVLSTEPAKSIYSKSVLTFLIDHLITHYTRTVKRSGSICTRGLFHITIVLIIYTLIEIYTILSRFVRWCPNTELFDKNHSWSSSART